MSNELVVLGTGLSTVIQIGKIRELTARYGLEFDEGKTHTHPWSKSDQDNLRLVCFHFEINGAWLGADTPPNIKRFMVEAMKLPGVYGECPECCKVTVTFSVVSNRFFEKI